MIPVGEHLAVSHQLYQMIGPSSCALGLTGETAARLKWLHSPFILQLCKQTEKSQSQKHCNLIGNKMLAREKPFFLLLYCSHPLKSAVGMCASFVSQESESREAGASGRGVRGFLFLLQILT